MDKKVVVVYFSQLGGRLIAHQKIVLDADARAIAKITGCDYGGHYDAASEYLGKLFFVPDDTLLLDEAIALGIHDCTHLYGGVVPYPFVKTKAITHPLIHDAAERPTGWSDLFFKRVSDVVLPGYTVFSASDARHAAARMLTRGTFRLKKPLGASAKGQTLVTHIDELDAFLETVPSEEMATYGLVLEENLQNVTTLSVGHVTVGPFKMAYHGVQRLVKDNEGRSVYGGSNLVCVRGGWEALENLSVSPQVRSAVAAAKQYDEAMSEYTGFMATRRNYDVGQGFDAKGDTVSGVFESSWRVGGASSAELLALEMLAQDHSLEIVEASHVEKFGKGHDVPPEAIIHFRGDDMEAGPIVRYTVVRRAQRVEDRTIA